MVGFSATYVDTDTFTISGDHTTEFCVDRRVKADCGVDGYKHGTIESSSYSSPNTTVNMLSSNDDLTSNLVFVWYGEQSSGSTGTIPIHSHDGTEGSGGGIDKYIPNYNETDQGLSGNNNQTIKSYVDNIRADKAIIYLKNNSGNATTTYTLTTNETIPSNITLEFDNGAILDGAGTLTCAGQIIAGRQQIFGVTFAPVLSGLIEKVYPEWWGNNITPGTTDMTTEFQAAIDAVEAMAADQRAKVSLAGVKYLISSELTVEQGGVTIEGIFANTWIISNHATANILKLGDGTNYLYRFTLRNLMLTKSVTASAGYAIATDYIERLLVDNVEIYGNSNVYGGIKFYKSWDATITKTVRINGLVDRGIHVEGSATKQAGEMHIAADISTNGSHGIYISIYTEGFYIQNAVVYNSTGTGIIIEGTATDSPKNILIQNTTIDTSGVRNIYGEYCDRVLVEDCYIGESTTDGIKFGENTSRIMIKGGINVQSNQYGIVLDGDDITISNVLIESASKDSDNTYDAIYVGEHCNDISIKNNDIIDPLTDTRYGINAHASASNVTIEGNRIETMQTDYLNVGTNCIVRNNNPNTETLTIASPTLQPWGITKIDSTSNAVNGTLGSGQYVGQIKTIVMTEASNSSTITITNHETEDSEVATFDAVDETGVFMWTGTEWVTIKATCTFV